jgi:hypothetical protein
MKKAFPLRISTELWEDVRRLAAADLRSVNAEIEYLLRESVARRLRRRPDQEEVESEG